MSTKTTKRFMGHTTVKDATQGIAEIEFATLDVIDHDGDVMTKDSLPWGTPVVVSAYGHASWEGGTANLPVGKGTIRRDGNVAVADIKFFLNTPGGRDTFEVVKELAEDDLQEWSFSLHDVESERITKDGRPARLLKRVGLVKEVSPTLMGAGIGTGTRTVKGQRDGRVKQLQSSVRRLLALAGRDRWSGDAYAWVDDFDLDEGFVVYGVEAWVDGSWQSTLVQVSFTRTDTSVTLADDEQEVHPTTVFIPKRYHEHAESVLADVAGLVERTTEIVALRSTKGKAMTESHAELLSLISGRLDDVKRLLEQDDPAPPPAPDGTKAIDEARAILMLAQTKGVTDTWTPSRSPN